MRKLLPLALLLATFCAQSPTLKSVPAGQAEVTTDDHGLTIEEEARVLAMEDRRAYDAALVDAWARHPNPIHRIRIARALAQIGAHDFIDDYADDVLHPVFERRVGVPQLITLAKDSDRRVREMAAFALGEVGDQGGVDALFQLANDPDLGVAAEAAEALSKFGGQDEFVFKHFPRYTWMLDEGVAEGVRARATRYLFRFETEKAGEAATAALASKSAAVRQEAAYSLARKPHPPAVPQLELLLTDPSVLTRGYAAAALGRVAEARSAAPLFTLLADAHPWVRTNAAVALTRIAGAHNITRPEDLPRVFAAVDDADPGVRASMIDLLGYYAEGDEAARSRLLDVLQNGTQWERELAAGSIAKHFDARSRPFVRMMALPLSNWQIVRVLESTSLKPNGVALRRQYAGHADPFVRANAISAIPNDTVKDEIALVRNAFQDKDVVVRSNAYDRYARFAEDRVEEKASSKNKLPDAVTEKLKESVRQKLEEQKKAKSSEKELGEVWLKTLREAETRERGEAMNDGRITAISAIASWDHPQRKEYLLSFLGDADPVVRRVASDLLLDKHKVRRRYTPLPVSKSAKEYEEIARWARRPHTATIHMTRGVIEMALLTQDAPMTTWNFAQLAKKGFYNNTSFMRVVPNFVIQGGDPRNDQNGGPGYAIRDEINLQKYTRGAVGMALSGPDTGGSQFFITHSPQPHLDGGYTIFGRVYDGMTSVVDQTERGDRVETIAIDERPPATTEQIGSVRNVSLPLQIGPMTAERVNDLPEYQQRKSEYQPDSTVLEMMKSYVRPGDRIEVYMGTWCNDSQREVPKFLRIVDDLRAQGVELPVTYFALDRSKQKPAELINGKSVDKVATFIYYRDGRELGRIVETPIAVFEDDLLAIVAKQ